MRRRPAIAPHVRRAGRELGGDRTAMPGADQPEPDHDAPNHSEPGDRQPAGDVGHGRQHADEQRGDRPEQDGAASRARPADGGRAEQLGAPGLLLDAGVAAYQHERRAPRSTRVQHRHLGHRQLAEAVDVEDRAVERDHRAGLALIARAAATRSAGVA